MNPNWSAGCHLELMSNFKAAEREEKQSYLTVTNMNVNEDGLLPIKVKLLP